MHWNNQTIELALARSEMAASVELPIQHYRELLRLAQRGMILQEGWVAVPRNPTEEMVERGNIFSFSAFDNQHQSDTDLIYRAMIAAAPKMEEQ